MKIEKDFSLKEYNTFGIDAQTSWFVTYDSVGDLETLIRDEYFQECRYLHIGEGSNLLFLANFHGIVLYSQIKSIDLIQESKDYAVIRVGSGVIWDDFVAYAVLHNLYGVENLSLIPGQVGSAAIQNIGAYGVEVEQFIESVHSIHRRSGEKRIWSHAECGYAYRHSVFKEPEQSDYIITHVDLRLSKIPTLSLGYADIARYFEARAIAPSLSAVREAVIEIRQNKLPDPAEFGNAGSYFMNPIVAHDEAQQLLMQYPDMPHYPIGDGKTKLAAGWLIDQCGLRGYKSKRAGVYEKQALVLINLGNATGQDVANLALYVQSMVQEKFGITLYPEVKYIS